MCVCWKCRFASFCGQTNNKSDAVNGFGFECRIMIIKCLSSTREFVVCLCCGKKDTTKVNKLRMDNRRLLQITNDLRIWTMIIVIHLMTMILCWMTIYSAILARCYREDLSQIHSSGIVPLFCSLCAVVLTIFVIGGVYMFVVFGSRSDLKYHLYWTWRDWVIIR